MDKELKDKLKNLKGNVDKSKSKGPCKSCKEKKPVTELPPLLDEFEVIYVPTPEEIKIAYVELGNKDINKVRPMINKVFNALFGEEFNFNCSSCFNAQAHKLKIYIAENNI